MVEFIVGKGIDAFWTPTPGSFSNLDISGRYTSSISATSVLPGNIRKEMKAETLVSALRGKSGEVQ
jgi:hypothetical protein